MTSRTLCYCLLLISLVIGVTADCPQNDNTSPTITCPHEVTILGKSVKVRSAANKSVALDDCGISSITQDPPEGTGLEFNSTTLVNVTATDLAGNSASCQWKITVPPLEIVATISFNIPLGKSVVKDYPVVPNGTTGVIFSVQGSLSEHLSGTRLRGIVKQGNATRTSIVLNSTLSSATGNIVTPTVYSETSPVVITLKATGVEAENVVTFQFYGQVAF